MGRFNHIVVVYNEKSVNESVPCWGREKNFSDLEEARHWIKTQENESAEFEFVRIYNDITRENIKKEEVL